jgi:hypothetical protein
VGRLSLVWSSQRGSDAELAPVRPEILSHCQGIDWISPLGVPVVIMVYYELVWTFCLALPVLILEFMTCSKL